MSWRFEDFSTVPERVGPLTVYGHKRLADVVLCGCCGGVYDVGGELQQHIAETRDARGSRES